MRRARLVFGLFLLFNSTLVEPTKLSAAPTVRHTSTNWKLVPSLKYDALCLLNVLSGDPYYLQYYQAEYDHFHPLFTAEENAAFAQLKRVLKDEGQGIVSAELALFYSVVNDESLAEMIHTAQDSSGMERGLRATTYWNAEAWEGYKKTMPALQTALGALERVGFPAYWEQNVKPRIEKRIAELSADLPEYNIVPAVESLLGVPLSSNSITVYLLAYSEPHGIRITGLRYLTHVSYPFPIVLHNAIHESMHPPYDVRKRALRQAIDRLGREPLIVDKVQHHDASFGYNDAAGYIEEDSVQALEQIVSEKFGVQHDAREYWREQDEGMHILAAAIYRQYTKALRQGSPAYSKWFVAAVRNGELRGAELQDAVNDVLLIAPSPAPE
jgi:hypothetical protein